MAAFGRGEEADFTEAEGVEDLSTEAVASKVHADRIKGAGWVGVGLRDLETGAGVGDVEEGAFSLIGDMAQGAVDGGVRIGGEDIAEDIFRLDPDESGAGIHLAHGESEVDAVVGERAKEVKGPLAEGVLEGARKDALDQFFPAVAVFDELLDGDQFEAESAAVLEQFGEAGHGAILVENFAEHAGGGQAGEDGEVDGRLGVAGALQDAARSGAEGKDVARLDQLVGGRVRVADDADGGAAVSGTDAGGDSLGGIDGDGEIGAVAFPVIGDHRVEAEPLKLMFDSGDADQAAAMADHHVDGFWGGLGGGHDQIPLIFPVLVINDNDQFAGGDIVEGGLYGIKRIGGHGLGRWRGLGGLARPSQGGICGQRENILWYGLMADGDIEVSARLMFAQDLDRVAN